MGHQDEKAGGIRIAHIMYMPPQTMKPKLVLVANWPWMQWGVM